MGSTSHPRVTFALLIVGSTLAVFAMVSADVPGWWIVLYSALQPVAFRLLILASDQAGPGRLWRSVRVFGAMRRGEIVLHYQPKVDVATGRPAGVEALARWEHRRRGLLPPSQWLDATEHRWMEWRFCAHVLRLAIRQAAAWRDAGGDFVVCVNVAPSCFVRRGLPQLVARALKEHGLAGTFLCIELTEEAFELSEQSRAIAQELTDLGVTLALDDFGVGHSSMDRLVSLPLNELKIDRRFVSRMVVSDRNGAVVRAAVGLAHSLGMTVVAEGVESAETMRSLELLGCDVAQGFLFSPPLPSDQLDAWWRSDRASRFTSAVLR
jgi:EAL domain-containing protein (putative c-di-GMP-specific phosphodiesterase class I)